VPSAFDVKSALAAMWRALPDQLCIPRGMSRQLNDRTTIDVLRDVTTRRRNRFVLLIISAGFQTAEQHQQTPPLAWFQARPIDFSATAYIAGGGMRSWHAQYDGSASLTMYLDGVKAHGLHLPQKPDDFARQGRLLVIKL
jgi:hypothetical protein